MSDATMARLLLTRAARPCLVELEDVDGREIIARCEGAKVGSINFDSIGDEVYIWHVENLTRKGDEAEVISGLGTALLDIVESKGKIALDSFEEAAPFYEKRGMTLRKELEFCSNDVTIAAAQARLEEQVKLMLKFEAEGLKHVS